MNHWYPSRTRAETLRTELVSLERVAAHQIADVAAHLPLLSEELTKAGRRPEFPRYQIPRWVWVASQFRLHGGAGESIGVKSGAALNFLSQRLALRKMTEQDVQDLNWVLDSVIRTLSQHVPASDLRS